MCYRESRFKQKASIQSRWQQRDSSRWHGWVVTRIPIIFLCCLLCVWILCNFRVSWKLPSFLSRKAIVRYDRDQSIMPSGFAKPTVKFNWLAFNVHSSFSAQIWLGIIAKTLTFPKRCPTHINSRYRARSRARKEACSYFGANTRSYPESC